MESPRMVLPLMVMVGVALMPFCAGQGSWSRRLAQDSGYYSKSSYPSSSGSSTPRRNMQKLLLADYALAQLSPNGQSSLSLLDEMFRGGSQQTAPRVRQIFTLPRDRSLHSSSRGLPRAILSRDTHLRNTHSPDTFSRDRYAILSSHDPADRYSSYSYNRAYTRSRRPTRGGHSLSDYRGGNSLRDYREGNSLSDFLGIRKSITSRPRFGRPGTFLRSLSTPSLRSDPLTKQHAVYQQGQGQTHLQGQGQTQVQTQAPRIDPTTYSPVVYKSVVSHQHHIVPIVVKQATVPTRPPVPTLNPMAGFNAGYRQGVLYGGAMAQARPRHSQYIKIEDKNKGVVVPHETDPQLTKIKLDEGFTVIMNNSSPYKKIVNLPLPNSEEEADNLRHYLEKMDAPRYIVELIQYPPIMPEAPMMPAMAAAPMMPAMAAAPMMPAMAAAPMMPAMAAAPMMPAMAAAPAANAHIAPMSAGTSAVAAPASQAIMAQTQPIAGVAGVAAATGTMAGAPAAAHTSVSVTTGTAGGNIKTVYVTYDDLSVDSILVKAYTTVPGASSYPLASAHGNGKFVLTALDMQLTPQQFAELHHSPNYVGGAHHIGKRKALNSLKSRWLGGEVPFEIEAGGFDQDDTARIITAMSEWQAGTCINFRPAVATDVNILVFQNGSGCSSNVGMIGGRQTLTLQKECRVPKILLHEIGHALGLIHEHQREDRDRYLKINYSNIKPGGIKDFDLFKTGSVDNSLHTYDYLSIMHYGKEAFANMHGQSTMEAVDPKFTNLMGTSKRLSYSDLITVNSMYNCNRRRAHPAKPAQAAQSAQSAQSPKAPQTAKAAQVSQVDQVAQAYQAAHAAVNAARTARSVSTVQKTANPVQYQRQYG